MAKKRSARKKAVRAKSKRTKARTKKSLLKIKPVRPKNGKGPSAQIHQGVSSAPDVVVEAESDTLEATEEHGGGSVVD